MTTVLARATPPAVLLIALVCATHAQAQTPTILDRTALIVTGSSGFDPAATEWRHDAVSLELSTAVHDRIRTHGVISRWRFDGRSCIDDGCDLTATEFGIGVDYVTRPTPLLMLTAGPRVGYIHERFDQRFTWRARAAAAFAPDRLLAPRVEVAYWSDPSRDRQGVFASVGVQIALRGVSTQPAATER